MPLKRSFKDERAVLDYIHVLKQLNLLKLNWTNSLLRHDELALVAIYRWLNRVTSEKK